MPDEPRRPENAHPANAPGDFYVEDQCCTLCGVPQLVAPELFSILEQSDQTSHCYVRRQPATEAEVDSMLNVISAAELGCIRYAGTDPSILDRLTAAEQSTACDAIPQHPPPGIFDELKQWLRRTLSKSS